MQFYNEEDLSDVVLVVAGSRYFSHKFVLAKSSDVFRTMLYEKNWTQVPTNNSVSFSLSTNYRGYYSWATYQG